MSNFNNITNGGSGSDNFQTPKYAIEPLLRYIPKQSIVWEPCKGAGSIVEFFVSGGYRAFGTDKSSGIDFLNMDTSQYSNMCDVIVTNPPYTMKDQFLGKCYEVGVPFALLLPLTAIEGRRRQALYRKYGVEIIIPDRRINFVPPTEGKKSSAWFASAWFTHGLNIGSALTFYETK